MNAFTKINALNIALASRGVLAPEFVCGCCGGTYDRDGHMADRYTEEHTNAVIAAFGADVCDGCADDFEPQNDSADYTNEDEAYDLWKEEQVA